MVGLLPLEQCILVRIQVSEPRKNHAFKVWFFRCDSRGAAICNKNTSPHEPEGRRVSRWFVGW